jgi:hypothetical protein
MLCRELQATRQYVQRFAEKVKIRSRHVRAQAFQVQIKIHIMQDTVIWSPLDAFDGTVSEQKETINI